MRIVPVLGGVLLAAAGFTSAQDLESVGQGHALYLVNCLPCHGADARGTGPRATTLAVPVPDLTRIGERDGTFEPTHVMVAIRGDHSRGEEREMPRFGYAFARRDTEAGAAIRVYCLMRYLEAIQGGVPMAAETPRKE